MNVQKCEGIVPLSFCLQEYNLPVIVTAAHESLGKTQGEQFLC